MKKTIKKKTIVFINPPRHDEDTYSDFAPGESRDPPFGLCYLASMVRKHGYRPYIVDAEALRYSLKQTAENALKYKPDYIGITATTYAVNSAISIAKYLRKKTKAKLIIGGCHVSILPKDLMPYFDVGVIGEGEYTLIELLDAFENKKPLKNIRGLVYKQKERLVKTGKRPYIIDLDELPKPAFDLLPNLTKYYRLPVQSTIKLPSMSFITSRGCPEQCTFCDKTICGSRVRAHSAEYVYDVIKWLVDKYKIKSMMFHDDNFLLFRKRNLDLVRLLKKNGIDLKFNCLARVDITSEDYLTKLKEGGLWQVNFGIETASQKILDFFKKGISLEQVEKAVNIFDEIGIRTKGLLMIGNPFESKKTLEQTKRFVMKLKLKDVSIAYFTPFPGTKIFPDIQKYGKLVDTYDKFNMFWVVFVPNGLKKEDLEHYYIGIYKNFYLRPNIALDYFLRFFSIRKLEPYTRGLHVLFKGVMKGS